MNIVAFAGKKGSGKSTLCNFIHGYFMKMTDLIDGFHLLDNGDLVIETDVLGDDGQLSKGTGSIDVKRTDLEFAMWAAQSMWPVVKHYAFASPFKEMAVDLFGLNKDHVYGSNEDKNNLTDYSWEDMPFKTKQKGLMTVREFLQALGSEIFRKIYEDIWVDKAVADMNIESPEVATVSDVRYKNEFNGIKKAGGKVILLTGGVDGDKHSSENDLEGLEFDAIIDTANQTVDESCHQLVELLNSWGIIPEEIIIEKAQEYKPRSIAKIK